MIKEFMKKATLAYEQGSPIISDAEYDSLERMYGQLMAGTGEVTHSRRMYSLRKHYDKDGDPPLNINLCIRTPKFDGLAVALYYVKGSLVLALTRGDGIKGRDVTDKMKLLVPTDLLSDFSGQVTGEVVADKETPNSRNFASGALNLKDMKQVESRIKEGCMVFIAYGATQEGQDEGVEGIPDFLGTLDFLDSLGFVVVNRPNLESYYPTDGQVYRLSDNGAFFRAGYTEQFPRGAFAWKEEQDSVVTTLLDVVWQTGKTGRVTPVAVLEPINIEGANISRATLNNIAYIEALNLEIGCQVEVIRSGEIIPKIIKRVD